MPQPRPVAAQNIPLHCPLQRLPARRRRTVQLGRLDQLPLDSRDVASPECQPLTHPIGHLEPARQALVDITAGPSDRDPPPDRSFRDGQTFGHQLYVLRCNPTLTIQRHQPPDRRHSRKSVVVAHARTSIDLRLREVARSSTNSYGSATDKSEQIDDIQVSTY
jgi:hypothetical protein